MQVQPSFDIANFYTKDINGRFDFFITLDTALRLGTFTQ